MNARTIRCFLGMVISVGLLSLATPARATIVVPGTAATADSNATLGTLLQTLTDHYSVSLGGGSVESGTLVVNAYRSTAATFTGDISFTYQVTVDANSASSITSITAFDFASGGPAGSVVTDVSAFASGADQSSPNNVFRSGFGGGHVVSFNFNQGNAEIQPGQSSDVLVIRTNATSYTSGVATVQGAGAVTLAGFTPLLVSVPEPGSMGLLALGVVGMFLSFRVRAGRKTA